MWLTTKFACPPIQESRMKTHLMTVMIAVLFITPTSPAEMTGDELVEVMTTDPELAAIPIVMATAAASPLRTQRMLERGCRAVLAKPLDEDSFLDAVRDALEPRLRSPG